MSASAPPVVKDPTDTLAVLVAARAWLGDKAHWTRSLYWEGANGLAARDATTTVRTCGDGALSLVAGGKSFIDWPIHARELLLAACNGKAPSAVNDSWAGYKKIIAAYDKAIAAERAAREASA